MDRRDRASVSLDCLSDPQKKTLCYFNTDTNCAAILGMRYFGEHKKGTLTLAWAIANRNGYASCHGGQKEYTLDDGSKFVAAVFGLSGSGKSTLTHAKHGGKYPAIKVLHDDAFIINTDTCASIALEPTYFDKTSDYPDRLRGQQVSADRAELLRHPGRGRQDRLRHRGYPQWQRPGHQVQAVVSQPGG